VPAATAEAPGGSPTLQGVITRLALEKASGSIVASVLIGNLPFTATLPEQQVREHGLYPGRAVALTYDLDSVSWV
jgi:hypothetical protein